MPDLTSDELDVFTRHADQLLARYADQLFARYAERNWTVNTTDPYDGMTQDEIDELVMSFNPREIGE